MTIEGGEGKAGGKRSEEGKRGGERAESEDAKFLFIATETV